ncbi:hypothetical protein N7454_006260 [Penicillium verhagenii]|nr:hypothetical protein N7454_006260 [Penicillium verhagenii]
MAAIPREEPLLAPPVTFSDDQSFQAEEEDALLTGERAERRHAERRGWIFWKEIGLLAWAILATIIVVVLGVVYQHELSKPNHATKDTWGPGGKPSGKRNLIFMVSDGMGPASLSMTRSFRQHTEGLPIDNTLILDQHYIGTSRTRSSSSLVTDSAAGATAFSCGFKSYNGAISVLPDHTPCGTVLEAASLAGYKTGLVVTTRLTDATPACFASHANLRQYEDSIAEQEVGENPLGRVVDLMLGGGRCHFVPNTTPGSCRADDRDIVGLAAKNGFKLVNDRAGFDALNGGTQAKLPLLGLFADRDIPYEIDRRTQNDVYPSLEEMARTALTALSEATRDSEQGFFLMIEGSRIDHAGHGNDPAAQVHEVLAFDKAFAAVVDFLEKDSTPESLSVHPTMRLAVWRLLDNFTRILTLQYTAAKLKEYLAGTGANVEESQKKAYVRQTLLEKYLGITDASEKEVDSLLHPQSGISAGYLFADIVSRRSQIGWSTHGHSAVDVNIYASSTKGAWPLVGNKENTDVGTFLASYLDLDVNAVTKRLQTSASWSASSDEVSTQADYQWMGHPSGLDISTETLDAYHGDFKRSLEDCGCGGLH